MTRSRIEDVAPFSPAADYVGRVVRVPTERVKRLPGQPRTHFDARALEFLRDSIQEVGQQQPATVVPWEDGSFRLRDGERRWRCCRELKIPLIALVADAKSEEEEFELSAVANMNREGHSPLEKALAMKRLRDGSLKRSAAQIARTFGVTPTTVYSYLLVVDQLPQQIIDLMDPTKRGGRKRTLQLTAAVYLTALKDHPREQMTLAVRIANECIPLAQAKALIDGVADRKGVSTGRGREQRPSDRLELLRSAMEKFNLRLERFSRENNRDLEDLIGFMSRSHFSELLHDVDEILRSVTALRLRLLAIDEVGAKRHAGMVA